MRSAGPLIEPSVSLPELDPISHGVRHHISCTSALFRSPSGWHNLSDRVDWSA